MQMKSDIIIVDDEPDVDPIVSAKWQLRVDLVASEQFGLARFIEFVRENESRIRTTFDEKEKAELRRGMERILGDKFSADDSAYVTSVFGSLRKPEPPPVKEPPQYLRNLTPRERIEPMGTCTFEYFCLWLDISETFVRVLNDEDYALLEDTIWQVCQRDVGLPFQRHFEEGDCERLLKKARSFRA